MEIMEQIKSIFIKIFQIMGHQAGTLADTFQFIEELVMAFFRGFQDSLKTERLINLVNVG
jgi:hypothetical protein